MLVRQADRHVAAPPAAWVILEGRRRRRRVDDLPRSTSLSLGLSEQLVVEPDLDAAMGGAKPHCSPGDLVSPLPQAQRLERELNALWQRRFGAAAHRCRLVLDYGHRPVIGQLDGVAAASQIEALGADVDGAHAHGSRGARIIHGGVVRDALRHLPGVRALSVHLEPGPAGAEGMVGDEADRERIVRSRHSPTLSPRAKVKDTLCPVDRFTREKITTSRIPSARRRAASEAARSALPICSSGRWSKHRRRAIDTGASNTGSVAPCPSRQKQGVVARPLADCPTGRRLRPSAPATDGQRRHVFRAATTQSCRPPRRAIGGCPDRRGTLTAIPSGL